LCPRAVSAVEVQELVSEEVWERYQRFRRDLDIAMDEGRRHCPTPGCSGVISKPANRWREVRAFAAFASMIVSTAAAAGAAGAGAAWLWGYAPAAPAAACLAGALLGLLLARPRALLRALGPATGGLCATCPECGRRACFVCGEPWHEGFICLEVRDSLVEAWAAARDAERCPRCGTMIERSAGCNHMTCRRGFGGCGYEFCWLCREEYLPGHFGNGRCPQYGGAPDHDFFRGSYLVWILPAFVLLSGVFAADALLAPPAGAPAMLWLTAMGLAGFVCPRASKRRRTAARPLAAAVGGPLLGVAMALGWLGTLRSCGELWASAVGLVALEVTGMCADRPPRWRSGDGWCGRCLWYLGRRLGSLALAVGFVAAVDGFSCFVAWLNDPGVCHKPDTWGCWLVCVLRVGAALTIVAMVLAVLALGGIVLRPGLVDAIDPNSWWMGSAGVARMVALAGLITVSPARVHGFYHAGDWGLLCVACMLAVLSASRCMLAIFRWRRSSWPLPCLAISALWGVRLHFELLGRMNIPAPRGLRGSLALCAQLMAGLLAGTAAVRPLGVAYLQGTGGRQAPGTLLARSSIAALCGAAGLALDVLRDYPPALFVERLAECVVVAAILGGCFALQLLPSEGGQAAGAHPVRRAAAV